MHTFGHIKLGFNTTEGLHCSGGGGGGGGGGEDGDMLVLQLCR